MSSDVQRVVYLLSIGDLLYKTVGLFIIVLSTIGNLCNCFVFLRISALNKHPNALFLLGSSIGSLLFINIGLWPPLLQTFNGINLSNLNLFWCKSSTWLVYSAGCVSFMCHCFGAFGQFLITSPKIQLQRLITRFRARLMIMCTAIIWLSIFLPIPIFNNLIATSPTTFQCGSSFPTIDRYLAYWVIIGYYFLPIVLTSILFSLTWYNLRQLLRRRRSLEGAVTRMMLVQMIVILITGIPAGVFVSFLLATQYSTKTPIRSAYEYLIFLLLTLLTFLSNGMSFWIYLFASSAFRKHLKEYYFNSKFIKNRIRPIFITTDQINVPQ